MIKIAALILLWATTAFAQPVVPPMKAHFIDVGQGDATLLEFDCGAVLIDAGGDKSEPLVAYLKEFFERREDLNNTLNAIFITHTHVDHNRALKDVAVTYDVTRYIHNGIYTGSGRHAATWIRDQTIIDQHSVNGSDVFRTQKGALDPMLDPVDCGFIDPKIRVLFAPFEENPGWSDSEFENGNNQSLVIRIDYGEFSILFTGDLEDVAIETLVDHYKGTDMLDVDLYQVGHHGSDNGTTIPLLKAMTPDVAVISMGEWNDGLDGYSMFSTYAYGHPRKRIVELLQMAVTSKPSRKVRVALQPRNFENHEISEAVYGTGWDGNVIVTGWANGRLHVE